MKFTSAVLLMSVSLLKHDTVMLRMVQSTLA